METRVISLRLPSATAAALKRSASDARLSVAEGLEWLVRNSLTNFVLLRELADCPEGCDSKLDARIPDAVLNSLKSASVQLGISVSVYIRKLLYHFYVTKRLRYVQTDGRYTLAYRHD